jgi:ribosomal protein L29
MASFRDTITLYKSKNEELSTRLAQKQNELLEARMSKVVITEPNNPESPNKDVIEKLN